MDAAMNSIRLTISSITLATLLATGCGSKPAPTTTTTPPVKAATPVVEEPEKPRPVQSKSVEMPTKVETPSNTKPSTEPPTTTVDPELRRNVEKLARKEAGKWKIDEAAQEKLDELGPTAVDRLLPMFADKSADVRRGAAYQLLRQAASRDDLATAYTKLLDDSDSAIRGIALSAIGQFKPHQRAAAAPALAKVLATTQDDEQQRATAARILGDVGHEAIDLLPQLSAAAASDASVKVRSSALLAISRIAEPQQSAPVFIKSLSDADTAVRLMAVQRLRELGRDAAPALDDLAKLLDSKDEKIRRTAGETLVRIGSPSVQVFTAALDSSSRDAREIAVMALSKMGPLAKPALPALKKRLKDSDAKIKELARQAIVEIETQ
jgi:HEAT repeat protein